MKPMPENLDTHLDVIRQNLYGVPLAVMQTAEVLGVGLFDAWKVVLEGKGTIWHPRPINDPGMSDFAAGCAIFAAATQIRAGELHSQALNLSDALVGRAVLAGIER